MPLSLLCFSRPPSFSLSLPPFLFPSPPLPSSPQLPILSTRILSGYLSCPVLDFSIFMMISYVAAKCVKQGSVPGTRELEAVHFLSSSLSLCWPQALISLNWWSPVGSGCQSAAGWAEQDLGKEGLDALSKHFFFSSSHQAWFCRGPMWKELGFKLLSECAKLFKDL